MEISITGQESVTMPMTHIAASGMSTIALSEGWHSSVSQDSDLDESGCMDMVSYLVEEGIIPDFIIPLSQRDCSGSCVVRIAECLGDGIYQGQWMKTISSNGSTGPSVLGVVL